MTRKRLMNGTLFSLGVALALAATAPTASAIIIVGGRTALFGVAAGQTIEASIVNAGDEKGKIAPCLRLFDIVGEVLFEVEAREPVSHGEGVVFEIPAGALDIADRLSVRLQVELEGANPGTVRDDYLVSIEVVDDESGATALRIPTTFGAN